VLTTRGRRCRRVTLDALSLLHPAGPGLERPAHRAGPDDDLVLVDGCFLQHPEFLGAWDLVIYIRSGPPQPAGPYEDPDRAPAATRYLIQVDPEGIADLVVDLHDPGWPVLRRIDPAVADRLDPGVFLTETRAFFAPRAATWDQRFPDDDPAYAAAVAELRLRPGQTALDVGCGTGRALPHLRAGVGPDGQVVGFDLTPEMLATACGYGRHAHGLLILADARRLPLPSMSVHGAFAAGLLPHLPDPGTGLAELPESSFPAAGWCCSTQAAGPPWPPATAAACGRTTCWPPIRFADSLTAPAGGWPATTMTPTTSSPSPTGFPEHPIKDP
jgi:hypothetical protein